MAESSTMTTERTRKWVLAAVAVSWLLAVVFFVGVNRDYTADVRLLQRAFSNWLPVGSMGTDKSLGLDYTKFHPQAVVDSYGYSFQYLAYLVGRIFSFVFGTEFTVDSESRVIVQNLCVAAVGFLGCIIIGRIIRVLTNSARAEIAAFCLAALTPMWAGHSWMNQKDIPFATGFIACTLLAVCALDHSRTDRPDGWFSLAPREVAAFSAVAVFLTFGTRPGIAILAAPLYAALLIDNRRLRVPNRNLLIGLSIGTVATLLTNPASLPNPVGWVVSAVQTGRDFQGWKGQVLSFGKFVNGEDFGFGMLFTEYFFQTPLLIMVGIAAAIGAAASMRGRIPTTWLPIVFHALIVPIVVFGLSENNYNAGRQYLFVVPGWITLGAIGLYNLSRFTKGRGVVVVRSVLAVLCLTLVFDHLTLFPHQYVYRNETFRLIPDFENRFEFDYWGVSGRQVARKLGALGEGTVFVGSGTSPSGNGRYTDALTAVPFVASGQTPTDDLSAPRIGAGWLYYWSPPIDEVFRRNLSRSCRESGRVTTRLWPARIALGSVYDCR